MVDQFPTGRQTAWGIPFVLAGAKGRRLISVVKGEPPVTVPITGTATYLCFLHDWVQSHESARPHDPQEGLVVGEYELEYRDGTRHVQPIRGRFEVAMNDKESPGPAWLAVPWRMRQTVDPAGPVVPEDARWGMLQYGLKQGHRWRQGQPLLYPLRNPHPQKTLRSVTIRGLSDSSLLVAALTIYDGAAHPLAHLPRRAYHMAAKNAVEIVSAEVDMGIVGRIDRAGSPRNRQWLSRPAQEEILGEQILHLTGAPDATVSMKLKRSGRTTKHRFSLGEAFHQGRSRSDGVALEVLGAQHQWMQVRVIDETTGKPTPVRIHFSGQRGNYIAPYGHHEQINTNWFEDYGADVVSNGCNYAYVTGEFTTDMPVGDVYVEISKGFEYETVRRKVTIRPGQKELKLQIGRWADLRRDNWVTADTHVHFISPHTAWLEGQAEGVNVVNLLASQWGRLFTNVGDIGGRIGGVDDDTIVYVGTENRNHMLGHMSMLGTRGLPVYPMCCGGPTESYVGDPDLMSLAEWARENRRKGGLVIRPHFPFCGHTEDPVPILQGLVDALEIGAYFEFSIQEWYRYLNCGYRVAVCGGTDKMSAGTALGWTRTYAQLKQNQPFDYSAWVDAVRAGRTFTSTGALIDLSVDGHGIGDTLRMSRSGGTVEVAATASCSLPLHRLEIVQNGKVVASSEAAGRGERKLQLRQSIRIDNSGWIAARCHQRWDIPEFRKNMKAAHTSPVYVTCGDTRAFSGPAAQHMLALVEGGIEYLQTLATVFDESSRKRMVKLFREAQHELKGRLLVEGGQAAHHGHGPYHHHGHSRDAGHRHD